MFDVYMKASPDIKPTVSDLIDHTLRLGKEEERKPLAPDYEHLSNFQTESCHKGLGVWIAYLPSRKPRRAAKSVLENIDQDPRLAHLQSISQAW